MRRLELAYKLSSWQGPARLLCFVRGMRVKLRSQTQNFGAVGRGGFVRIGGEGLDLVLAHGELYGFCGGLLGRGVRVCVIFVLETDVVLLEGIQRRAQGADVLVHVYLVATSSKGTI